MTQRKTVHKWFWVWDFEKEERWLNGMAQSGWLLDGVGFGAYHFAPCAPGEYAVRLEMHPYDKEYIRFMQDTGAEYVGRVLQWVYFRKKTQDGPFDLFSDLDSRIVHLERIGKMLALLSVANLLLGVTNSVNASSWGWINLVCATLLTYALGRIHGKKEALEEKRRLTE